jgi:hypothetical protein
MCLIIKSLGMLNAHKCVLCARHFPFNVHLDHRFTVIVHGIPYRLAELGDVLSTYPEVYAVLLDSRIAAMATAAVQSCIMDAVPWYVMPLSMPLEIVDVYDWHDMEWRTMHAFNDHADSAGLLDMKSTYMACWTRSMGDKRSWWSSRDG